MISLFLFVFFLPRGKLEEVDLEASVLRTRPSRETVLMVWYTDEGH